MCFCPTRDGSITKSTYLGKQRPDESEADRLGRVSIGRMEESGYTENNPKFTWTPDNPARFYTDNMAR